MTSRAANRKFAASASTITTSSTHTTSISSSSRQRWQPEEDGLVQEYVRRHGPREWHLLRSRMGVSASRFPRDPKSCAERWKNYLRPGLKKGPLSPEEQAVALALQARHGNRWKLIAKSLPGRTPKRLGKWWEVYSDRQRKQQEQEQDKSGGDFHQHQQQEAQKGVYDHILDTYVEKHVLPASSNVVLEDGLSLMSGISSPGAADSSGGAPVPGTPGPVLSLGTLGSSGAAAQSMTAHPQHMRPSGSYKNNYYSGGNIPPSTVPHQQLPPWLSTATGVDTGGAPPLVPTNSTITAATPSSSQPVGLSLTSGPISVGNNMTSAGPATRNSSQDQVPDMFPQLPTSQQALQPQLAALGSLWRDVEESRQGWLNYRKESAWRLGRLEQQLEAERARQAKNKVEECQARARALREEEALAMVQIDMEYREQMAAIQRDAESREGRLLEGWAARHARLARVLERIGNGAGAAAPAGPAGAPGGGVHVQPFGPQFRLGRPDNGGNN